jgi:hypothetical protein
MNRLKLVKPTSMGAAIPNSASPGPILTHYTHCADHLAPLTESYLELLAWECDGSALDRSSNVSSSYPRVCQDGRLENGPQISALSMKMASTAKARMAWKRRPLSVTETSFHVGLTPF